MAYIVAALTSMQRRWRGHLQKPKAVELYHGLFCVVGGCGLCEALERVRVRLSVSGVVSLGASAVGNYWRGGGCAARFCACLWRRLLSVLETGLVDEGRVVVGLCRL